MMYMAGFNLQILRVEFSPNNNILYYFNTPHKVKKM